MERREFLALGGAAIGTAYGTRGLPRAAQDGVVGQPAPFKLKYAPHFGMFKNHQSDTIDQIKFMADQGFRAIEDNWMRRRPVDMQEKIRRELDKHKMEMGVFVANDGGFGVTFTSGKKEHRERFVKNCKESVEVAKRVGAKWATALCGNVDPRKPMGYQTAHVTEALKQGAAVCEEGGLVLVCEPLNNWANHPSFFLTTTPQAYALMKAVGSPSCKILFDIYHQQISEGNLIANINKAWDEIGYFQIGDVPGRNEPTTGEINYKNVFRHIHRKGWKGILGMEHGNARKGKDGELALLRAYREVDGF